MKLYNVRTKTKEEVTPITAGKLGLYVCGVTVYDHMHIGHARTYVSFEILKRWLQNYYDVTHVQNVTDVDDKIIARAGELGVSPREHAATWTQICLGEQRKLGISDADIMPAATTSMDGIIEYIEQIIGNGFAYATDAGNVYFDVQAYDEMASDKFPESSYGCLSRRDYREMAAGTRKAVESDKKHPADFALWKAAKPDEPQDARWESPWGEGRPGWHIECSFMSTNALQSQRIDIHGGGQDLIFPHHENEIAQSQACSGQAPFANFWVHTGFLNVEGQKMSKSLGNFIQVTQMLDELESKNASVEALRLYFAQTHYRSKIDFSRKGLDEAIVALERLQRTRQELTDAANGQEASVDDANQLWDDFCAAMDDDLHTPTALAALFRLQKLANEELSQGIDGTRATGILQVMEKMGDALTIFQDPVAKADGPPPELEEMLAKREAARAAKDWATADEMRDKITAAGFTIEDTATGPKLRKI